MARSKKGKSDGMKDLKPRKVMDAGKAASLRGGTDEAASVRGVRPARRRTSS